MTDSQERFASESVATLSNTAWTLRECSEQGCNGRAIAIRGNEFTVGRTADAALTIQKSDVSKRHAQLSIADGRPIVRDLDSTNGTFVNGRQVSESPLTSGDIVQFASTLFRVERQSISEHPATVEENSLSFAQALVQFEQVMSGGGFVPHFQPIVRLNGDVCVGYELLARSSLDELRNPAQMFATAARLGQEVALSELARREGARDAIGLPNCGNLFVNTHPKEIVNETFLASLFELRTIAPNLPITMEIHEAAVTDRDDMRRFCEVLKEIHMDLAYDDFGAGQARLDELSETSPHVVKFDIKLIRNLDTATSARQSMVATLVRMTRELGITPLAEGVETAAEAETCRQMGFELAQGYHFGRPASREQWLRDAAGN